MFIKILKSQWQNTFDKTKCYARGLLSRNQEWVRPIEGGFKRIGIK
jgi:hypothetical protein